MTEGSSGAASQSGANKSNSASKATAQDELNVSQDMSPLQLFTAATEFKKKYEFSNKKVERTIERYKQKLQELQQSNKLINQNEISIEKLENEVSEAKSFLNLLFRDSDKGGPFNKDTRINMQTCNDLYQEMKADEKKRHEQVRHQAFEHAAHNIDAQGDQDQLIGLLQEESSNLRAKMIQLTEENAKLKKDTRYQSERHKEDIHSLKNIIYEQTSEQGRLLLDAFKEGGPADLTEQSDNQSQDNSKNNNQKNNGNSNHSEETKAPSGLIISISNINEKLRNQIKELNEKVIFANETIALMEDQKLAVQNNQFAVATEQSDDDVSDNSNPSMVGRMINQANSRKIEAGHSYESSQVAQDQQAIETMQQRLEFLEMQNEEIENEMESSKAKARGLLMQKEMQERRLKMIIEKLESHMKNQLGMVQEQVNQVSKLSEDQLHMLYEQERDIENDVTQDIEDLALQKSARRQSNVFDNSMQSQNKSDSAKNSDDFAYQSEDCKELQLYIRNVFMKYLETLYSLNTGKKQFQIQKELRTIEGILLNQLKASFEQTRKMEELIKQFTDHKKKNFLKKGNLFKKKDKKKPQNFEIALQ